MPTTKPRTPKPGTSLTVKNPALAAEWHPTLNGTLTPSDVTPGTHYAPWWHCPVCLHAWTAAVYARTNGNGCPNCAGQLVTTTNSLQELHPALAREWHPTLNDHLTPNDVHAGSSRKAWWTCPKPTCQHTWKAVISSRAQGIGCPGCRGLVATPSNCLATNRPDVASQWHPALNGALSPMDVTPGSALEPWWQCGSCGHGWQAAVYARTSSAARGGCPACRGYVATPKNCLATLHPQLAGEWHPTRNAPLTPADVTPGSRKAVHWACGACAHTWKTVIASRALNGNGCRVCSASSRESRQENDLRDILADHLPIDTGQLVPRTDGRRAGQWSVDILSTELKLIIEFDGLWWHGPDTKHGVDRVGRDRRKADDLRAHGYTVVRVREEPLEPLHPHDVTVPYLAPAADVARTVLERLRELDVHAATAAA